MAEDQQLTADSDNTISSCPRLTAAYGWAQKSNRDGASRRGALRSRPRAGCYFLFLGFSSSAALRRKM